ncbi:hypothetical protein HRR83_007516 [Exophiala dermatitidis]|uniref:Uncharacterized protein n=1 Tax=Exophiala dermatitidis TaxID=5970 RepID=A0AAN6EPN4_EXODE|nr:hypothetical protein HRR74_006962 [Exophiala dermatitidis]KAJ4510575.1 hypothetical protein HRR73_006647 [Exophiala dermatitidis]KAJ4531520.1 hypothetical protein HRR77_009375 [Exophiala dermatitidis]KAJ4535102.1 hypothetical protein HRR76_007000 [Exophiala dermatitidis]KAJ4553368.1 hypothetical protein HRR79_009656 [Exophiala dermatitidis]
MQSPSASSFLQSGVCRNTVAEDVLNTNDSGSHGSRSATVTQNQRPQEEIWHLPIAVLQIWCPGKAEGGYLVLLASPAYPTHIRGRILTNRRPSRLPAIDMWDRQSDAVVSDYFERCIRNGRSAARAFAVMGKDVNYLNVNTGNVLNHLGRCLGVRTGF